MNSRREVIEQILTEAGEIIMSYRDKYGDVSVKEKNEIVTQADIASNQFIVDKLQSFFPEIEIYSEEESVNKSSSKNRWIVDPLDGTTPWVSGNSGFSISVALEENGQIVLGAVYDPVMKEFYFAQKGKGAIRNNEKIETKKGIQMKDAFMVVDWGNKDEKRKEGLNYFRNFFIPEMVARRIVPQFAPALGLCRIAEGRIHALVCNDTWVEDHSAGALILSESGGFCSNFYNTNSFNHRESGIIATNDKLLHERIVELLNK